MDYTKLLSYLTKPDIYAKSTAKFWDDEHISKGMLEAHLNPDFEGASRKHEFMDRSADWIVTIAPPQQYRNLLDLGCGPGLYTQRFYERGYQVTGIDYSTRSVEYARNMAMSKDYSITYRYQNYLNISYQEEFDVITLIYCDICVLSDEERELLLHKIYHALKPNGIFIVDVTTPTQYKGREEAKSWSYGGSDFWSDEQHLCLNAFYRYDDSNTMLNQMVVITEASANCYYLWDHTYTEEELKESLISSGFGRVELYGDFAGAKYQPDGCCICAVAVKL